MLTVFKKNLKAINFYIEKMKYSIDDSSPSFNKVCDHIVDYEILSKRIGRSLWKKRKFKNAR